jgi:hypothetical protein
LNNIAYIGYKPAQIGFGEATLATGGTLAPLTAVVDIAVAVIPFIISAINRGKPNPNDWQGWNALDSQMGFPIGTNVTGWIIKDGDSIQNEALNILQYIRAYGTNNVLTYNSHWNKTITAQDLANKLRRGGYVNEANQLLTPATPTQAVQNLQQTVQKSNWLLYAGIGLTLILLFKKK